LLREPRRALHARIAEALERQFAELAENQPELLAHHYTEAGLIEKAAGLWRRLIPKCARFAPTPPKCSPISSDANSRKHRPGRTDYFGHFFTIVLTETYLKGMRELVAKYGDHMQPHLVDAIKGTMTDTQITDAVIARKKCANQAWRFFRTYDLLLTPTIACPPFKQGIQGPEMIEGKKAGPFQSPSPTSST
jgi:Asp-tRNA(Asn)/Glu-tRNA(Gln) amidotransferase A subunit family amidase